MAKKILVLGATGAMGQYLVPMLAAKGYKVDAVSLDGGSGTIPGVRNIKGNGYDVDLRKGLLAENYDAIVDFLIYNTPMLPEVLPEMINSTGHYIYLSSYRIYAGKEIPVRETSPRLLDTADDILLRSSDDYCIYKARGEDIVRSFTDRSWTIIRPAITYSFMRYQLVTLEAYCTVGRALAGQKVILPVQAKDVQATMSWAGDAARMIAGLLFNPEAQHKTFTVSTAEHHTWGEIADYYKDICGLESVWVDKEDYLRMLGGSIYARWQLEHDRLYDRIIDNSAILAATSLKQEELRPLYDGLKYEISRCPADYARTVQDHPFNIAMNDYLKNL